jgi:YVTN family beta-propeller protein
MIETTTNEVIGGIPVGSAPVGLVVAGAPPSAR